MNSRVRLVLGLQLLTLTLWACKSKSDAFEVGIDRPGSDLTSFLVDEPDAQACYDACAKEARCQAWTLVKSGPNETRPRCWLKSKAPEPQKNERCISGIMRAPGH
jgi:hypothetical protein